MTSTTLIERIYIDVFVQCDRPGCSQLLTPEAGKIGNQKSADCVDAWAVLIADEAENLGWSVNERNEVFCPEHANEARLLN